MRPIPAFALILSCLIYAFGNAQIAGKKQLDSFFSALEESGKFMGNIMVVQNRENVYSIALGFSNLDSGTKADKNTQYRIGSISKTLTAVLVLQAVEEGKLNLSQTIEKFFPSIQKGDKITISHLLNHHSGIHNVTSNEDFLQWHNQPKTEKEMVDIIATGGIDFEPGQKGEYSNSNYILLSYILQQVYDKEYTTLLQEKISAPLSLHHTQFGDTCLSEQEITRSYTLDVKWNEVTATEVSVSMGAGGILMSAYDVSQFLQGLFDNTLLSKVALDTMLTQTDGYGMGIFKTSFAGKEAYTHDGKIDGFNAVFYYFPAEQTTYILLSNAEEYSLEKIHDLVLKATFNQSFEVPTIHSYKLSSDDLVPYLGVYSSNESPLIIEISRSGNRLLALPKEQRIFTMDAVDKDVFTHDKSGVTLEFTPVENKMVMKQGAQVLNFFRE